MGTLTRRFASDNSGANPGSAGTSDGRGHLCETSRISFDFDPDQFKAINDAYSTRGILEANVAAVRWPIVRQNRRRPSFGRRSPAPKRLSSKRMPVAHYMQRFA